MSTRGALRELWRIETSTFCSIRHNERIVLEEGHDFSDNGRYVYDDNERLIRLNEERLLQLRPQVWQAVGELHAAIIALLEERPNDLMLRTQAGRVIALGLPQVPYPNSNWSQQAIFDWMTRTIVDPDYNLVMQLERELDILLELAMPGLFTTA